MIDSWHYFPVDVVVDADEDYSFGLLYFLQDGELSSPTMKIPLLIEMFPGNSLILVIDEDLIAILPIDKVIDSLGGRLPVPSAVAPPGWGGNQTKRGAAKATSSAACSSFSLHQPPHPNLLPIAPF